MLVNSGRLIWNLIGMMYDMIGLQPAYSRFHIDRSESTNVHIMNAFPRSVAKKCCVIECPCVQKLLKRVRRSVCCVAMSWIRYGWLAQSFCYISHLLVWALINRNETCCGNFTRRQCCNTCPLLPGNKLACSAQWLDIYYTRGDYLAPTILLSAYQFCCNVTSPSDSPVQQPWCAADGLTCQVLHGLAILATLMAGPQQTHALFTDIKGTPHCFSSSSATVLWLLRRTTHVNWCRPRYLGPSSA